MIDAPAAWQPVFDLLHQESAKLWLGRIKMGALYSVVQRIKRALGPYVRLILGEL